MKRVLELPRCTSGCNGKELCDACLEIARTRILHCARKHALPFLKGNESFVRILDELPHITMRAELEVIVRRLYAFLTHVGAHLQASMDRIGEKEMQRAQQVQDGLMYVMRRLERVARRFFGYTEPLPVLGGV